MKLLIVDDEIHIVNYIKYLIDWEKIGFCEVFTTNKGTQAKEYILQEKPELVITDVQMPTVSGLDLATVINEKNLSTRVIILSGYSDFSYAQQAIRLGAVDYLVKPIRKADLLPVVKRALDTLFLNLSEGLLDADNENKFFIDMLSSFPLTKAEEEQINSKSQNYYVSWQNSPIYRSLKFRINGKYFTVFSKEKAPSSSVKNYKKLTRENIQLEFFSEYGDVEKVNYTFPEELEKFIEKENWDSLLSYLKKVEKTSHTLLYQMQLSIDLLKVLGEHFPNLHETLNLSDLFSESKNVFEYLKEFFLVQKQKEKGTAGEADYNQLIIEKIRKHIENHYSEEITLDVLSEVVHMHPVTVSRLFKEETGNTVMQYLLKIRLEEASKLLENSNLLVRDVAVLVGYKKTQHFTKLFKEHYGATPQKYRRKIQLRGEEEDEY